MSTSSLAKRRKMIRPDCAKSIFTISQIIFFCLFSFVTQRIRPAWEPPEFRLDPQEFGAGRRRSTEICSLSIRRGVFCFPTRDLFSSKKLTKKFFNQKKNEEVLRNNKSSFGSKRLQIGWQSCWIPAYNGRIERSRSTGSLAVQRPWSGFWNGRFS